MPIPPYSYTIVPLNRTGWGTTASDVTFGAASNAIDGSTGTIWATNGSFPAWIVLDMGAPVANSRSGWSILAVDSTAGGYPASNMLDANAGTIWSSNGGTSGFISLDFGSAQTFNNVGLQTRPSSNQGSPNAFDVYVSTDGISWGSIVASFIGDAGTANALTYYALPAAQTKRYLKIQVNSVYTPPSNVVLAEIYTANAGAIPTFDTVAVLPRQDGFLDFPGSIEIYVSTDGSTWGSAVYTASGLANDATQKTFGPFSGGAVTKRYVKYNILSAASGARVYQGAAEINVGTNSPLYITAANTRQPITPSASGAFHQPLKAPSPPTSGGGGGTTGGNYGYTA